MELRYVKCEAVSAQVPNLMICVQEYKSGNRGSPDRTKPIGTTEATPLHCGEFGLPWVRAWLLQTTSSTRHQLNPLHLAPEPIPPSTSHNHHPVVLTTRVLDCYTSLSCRFALALRSGSLSQATRGRDTQWLPRRSLQPPTTLSPPRPHLHTSHPESISVSQSPPSRWYTIRPPVATITSSLRPSPSVIRSACIANDKPPPPPR